MDHGPVEGEANLSLPIRTISSDSRHIGKGDALVALKGDNFDGHDYLEQAVEKGASVIISEKPAKLKVPVVVVSNTFMAMMQIGSALRKAFQGPVIAVTGSAGKSSTRDMIATLLGPGTTKSPKSYNNLLGVSKTLFLIEDSTKYLILEMGMNALGELETICDHFHPVAGLITNVGDAHVGRMGGQDKIYQAKKEVFDHLAEFPNETLGIVVNGDDPLVRKWPTKHFPSKLKEDLNFLRPPLTYLFPKWSRHSKTGSLLVEVREGAESVSVTLPAFWIASSP